MINQFCDFSWILRYAQSIQLIMTDLRIASIYLGNLAITHGFANQIRCF